MNTIFSEEERQEPPRQSGIAGLGLSDSASPGGDSAGGYGLDAEPESMGETIRRSGLAYAAAFTLFASVVFMLLIGWFFDLLAGTAPFGVIGGIVLGAIIGFVQFFRLAGRIFEK